MLYFGFTELHSRLATLFLRIHTFNFVLNLHILHQKVISYTVISISLQRNVLFTETYLLFVPFISE